MVQKDVSFEQVQISETQKPKRSVASSRRRSIFFTPPPVIVGESQSRRAVGKIFIFVIWLLENNNIFLVVDIFCFIERDPSTNYWDMMKDESKETRARVGTPLEEYYKERHITR